MKFIRTREHERTAKKNHSQPTIPVALRKKLLTASKEKAKQEQEDEQLTEQAGQTVSTVTQAVQPIIREESCRLTAMSAL